jgi:MFS family permease
MGSATSKRIDHGWRVVAAAFMIALFGWGIGFYGPGIYLQALQQRHGWGSAAIAPAITVYYLCGAALIWCAGRGFERFGVRPRVVTGVVAMACGLVLLTLVNGIWQAYGAFMVMSLGWAAMSGAAVNIIVAPWFERRRGLAVSLALNGASAGGVVIAPLLIALIGRLGFGPALWCAAVAMLVILVPIVVLVLRPRRAGEGAHAPATREEAWHLARVLRDRRFLTIAVPFALGLTVQVGFLTHQVAYLAPLVGTGAAGWAVSLTTACAIAGRITTGLVVDRIDRRTAACVNFLVQVAALAILVTAPSAPWLYLGCALFGLAVGNMISLPGLIVQHEFPKAHFARILALVVAINQVTFAFGPALLGALRQVGGSYTLPLAACLGLQVLAAIIVVAPRAGGADR